MTSQGETFAGFVDVTTNGSGSAAFSDFLMQRRTPWSQFTATATDLSNGDYVGVLGGCDHRACSPREKGDPQHHE